MNGGFEGVANALGELPTLYEQLGNLEQVKTMYEQELAALEAFVSSTSPLFTDSSKAFNYAMQGVAIINQSTANFDGTINFPAGADMSWLTNMEGVKFSSNLVDEKKKTISEDQKDTIEIKYGMNGVGTYPLVYVNGKYSVEKTRELTQAINKIGWENLKNLLPKLISSLSGYDDVKTVFDDKSSLGDKAESSLFLLLMLVPEAKLGKFAEALKGVKSLETVEDLAKISKAAGLTEKEAKALEDMWKSEKMSGRFADEIDNLDPNKINHIMQNKHDWGKVVIPPTWENVKPLVNEVMEKGRDTVIKGGIPAKELTINGQTITVSYVEMEGKIRISNAWVNY